MRKIFTRLFTTLLLTGGVMSASAAELGQQLTIDNGPISAGVDYELNVPGSYYTYTPSESGPVAFQTDYQGDVQYIAWPMGKEYSTYFAFYEYTDFLMSMTAQSAELTEEGWQFILDLTEGTTYYFGYPSTDTEMKAGFTFSILEDEVELEPSDIVTVTPTPGELIDQTEYNDILILSSTSITSYQSVTFNYNDQSIELGVAGDYKDFVTINGYSPTFIQIMISNQYRDLFAIAKNAGASKVEFIATGVVANGQKVTINNTGNEYVTVEDGTVTITYPLADVAEYLPEDSTWPETFYNFWEEGDKAGMATLEFSGDIESVEEAYVAMAQLNPTSTGSDASLETYDLVPVIDGNTITLDFTGVERSANISKVTVVVKTVKGANGLKVSFGEYGSALYQIIDYKNEPAPEPVFEPTYMEALPTFYYDNLPGKETAVFYWKETIQAIDVEVPLQATLTTPEGEEIRVAGTIATYYPDADDEPVAGEESQASNPDNALVFPISKYVDQYGAGAYNISFASIVMNGAGEWNQECDEDFQVKAAPAIADIEPTISVGADMIIISWGEAVSVYNPDKADIIILSEETLEEYRLNINNGVTIDESDVILDISDLGLEEGETYILNVPEYFFYLGNESQSNAVIYESFTAQSSGVASIDAAIQSGEVIYNLQGQKVKNPTKGIYIINGKKVIVK